MTTYFNVFCALVKKCICDNVKCTSIITKESNWFRVWYDKVLCIIGHWVSHVVLARDLYYTSDDEHNPINCFLLFQ